MGNQQEKKSTKMNPAQIAVVKRGIQPVSDNLKAVTGIVQAQPGKLVSTLTRTLKKVKPTDETKKPENTPKKMGSIISKVVTASKKPMGRELDAVTVKGSPEANLEFGLGTDKQMFPREDIIGASKAGFLSGIDVTSNNTIKQSGGKYNRMIPELKLGIQLYKNMLKKQQQGK